MSSWTTVTWLVLLVLALGVGFTFGAMLLHAYGRRQLISSIKYILNRLKVVESDLRHTSENGFVLKEIVKGRGLFDEEDFIELRRELVERPRQIEAERAELLRHAQVDETDPLSVKDFSNTVH